MSFFNTKHTPTSTLNKQKGFDCEFFSAKKTSQKGFFVVVSKKTDKKAVNRNLIKRRIKEAFRLVFKNEQQKTEDLRIKVFPKKESIKADFADLMSAVKNFLKYYKTIKH